ncbi:MAG: glycogen synthase GlgA [Defluviitaleaceae bacterium]|nr:glycogen synthase GlgA [Defluviitaleaceae bacterium]
MNKIKILFVASEAAPFIKSGGLGDVAGSLPKALADLGAEVLVVLPMHKNLNREHLTDLRHVDSMEVVMGATSYGFGLYTISANVPTYFIANQDFFNRDGLYGYDDDAQRYAFFTKAALSMLPSIDFQPDIIHFNDWQTGLGSLYLKDDFQKFTFYKDIRSIFTIHNLQYQGIFGDHVLSHLGLNHNCFTADKLEFYGNISFMKAGLKYADFVTTVSPTYANEIQTSQYGYGLEGVLSQQKDQLLGILNGIDYDEYNPQTSKDIAFNFNVDNLAGKTKNKAHLQKMLGLPVRDDVPLFAVVSRLAEQKGLDLIPAILGDFISNKDIQLVFLGNGEHHFEQMIAHAAHAHPDKINANIKFDAKLAHQYYAGADFFLMPSLFEPCGLSQLMAMRYGAIPVVRKTGGLADTVTPFNPKTGEGRGVIFENYDFGGIAWATEQAIHLYSDQDNFQKARKNAMKADFSWENSAKEYIRLYEKLNDNTK